MEKGLLLEEEEEAEVTLTNLTGVAAVVAVVAIESPQVEFGTMVMTFVSSVNQGTQPGIKLFDCSNMDTVLILHLWDNKWLRERWGNAKLIIPLILKPCRPPLCNIF